MQEKHRIFDRGTQCTCQCTSPSGIGETKARCNLAVIVLLCTTISRICLHQIAVTLSICLKLFLGVLNRTRKTDHCCFSTGEDRKNHPCHSYTYTSSSSRNESAPTDNRLPLYSPHLLLQSRDTEQVHMHMYFKGHGLLHTHRHKIRARQNKHPNCNFCGLTIISSFISKQKVHGLPASVLKIFHFLNPSVI